MKIGLILAMLIGILILANPVNADNANGTLNVKLANTDLFLNNVESVHVKIVKVENISETIVQESDESLPINISITTHPGVYKVYVRKSNSTILEYNNDSIGYILPPSGEVTVPTSATQGEIIPLFVNTFGTDVLSDAPWRFEPGMDIPVTHIVKDTDEYSLYIRDITIYDDAAPYNQDTGEDILVYTHPLERSFTEDFWHAIDSLSPSLFADRYPFAGQGPKKMMHVKHDIAYEADVHSYLWVESTSHPLSSLGDWYAGDTHYHSIYTDNAVEFGGPVEATVASGRAIGLDWVTLTDHSFDLDDPDGSSFNDWNNLVSDVNVYSLSDFIAIAGEEISCDNPNIGNYNHYLAYSISTRIFSGEFPDGTDSPLQCSDVVQQVNSQGGFGYVAHPFAKEDIGFGITYRNVWQDYSLSFTGLQIWNYVDYVKDSQQLQDGLTKWKELLGTGRHVFISGGSDAHGDFNERFGKVRTYVYSPSGLTESGILNALRNGRSTMTDGPLIVFDINGVKIGDTITVLRDSDFTVSIQGASSPEFGSTISYTVHAGIIGGSETQVESGSFSAYPSGSTPETLNAGTACNNQNCYIRIEATSSAGSTTYRAYTNPIWVSVVADTTPPSTPSLISPSNGASISDSTPTFEWSAASDDLSGVDYYQLQVDDNIGFGSPVINTTTTSTSYTALSALSDGTYYWRVRAVDKSGNIGGYSSTWSFTVFTGCVDATPPNTPTLIDPGGTDTDGDYQVDWSDVSDVGCAGLSHYELQESNTPSFSTISYNTSSSFYDFYGKENGDYYYRVRAWDNANNPSTWSSVVDITVDVPPSPKPDSHGGMA